MDPLEEFPRQLARTRGFTLGVPRSFRVAPDGSRVVFLRSRAGDDPVSCLWALDPASGEERCVFDPRTEGLGDDEALPEAERARRERVRERSSGVTAYATDREVRLAVFTVSGKPFIADLVEGSVDDLTVPGAVDDPRLDPTGRRVAYAADGTLHVRDLQGGNRVLAADDDPDTFWGLPEFVAAEEMRRLRGHWWSPDGALLAATRVDQRRVLTWHIGDPTDPAAAPRAIRYPQAGTDNADVTLFVFDVATGSRIEIGWNRLAYPYLARVLWEEGGPLTLLVESRDQRRVQLLEADATTGSTSVAADHEDPAWFTLFEDAPLRMDDGAVVMVVADHQADAYRLTVGGRPVTPPGLQVREVLSAGGDVLFLASEEPTDVHLWRWSLDGGAERLTHEPGVHSGAQGGEVLVRVTSTLDAPGSTATILRGGEEVATVASVAERPLVDPRPMFLRLGERELRSALLLPGGREPDHPLPVILDPYGGPGAFANRVLSSGGLFLTSQWLADHGFAVLVVDGRGMDGRGPAWDRLMFRDFTVALEDQVDALHAAAERFGFLDLSRVAMRGWSFGGYLSALAVLRRPDVFHAAVVGAPVTDLRLYDTHYMEQYLGNPVDEPEVYERNSVLPLAAELERPMLLIHGLADDNVYVANTLRLSTALFEAGRFPELVLIPNATHLTRSTAVTENILRVQLDFLTRMLRPA
ncbi:MAG TPA: prolyl oligopeptidase family serine peptidase [Actinomycetota bacterium]|nr:prolyl oligopeptidase family serine peptidase [Actinomycetota bacterium]